MVDWTLTVAVGLGSSYPTCCLGLLGAHSEQTVIYRHISGRTDAPQMLNEVPRERAEYIMWLDMDLLMNKMDFVLPLESYEGKDLVMHGQPEYILQGEARKGE